MNEYNRGHYFSAMDSINKSLPILKTARDKNNLAIAYSYLGKNYYRTNKIDSALFYLKKSDTIFQQISKSIYPEVRDGYELLINHYKKTGNKDQQLHYIERLMELDVTLVKDYRFLNESIVKKYDTPELLADKEQLIRELNRSNSFAGYSLMALSITLTIISFLFFLHYKKQKVYKQKFEALINKKDFSLDIIETVRENKMEENDIGIANEVVDQITMQLNDFVKNRDYLDSKLTLQKLSKKMNTNAKYLSKIVNHREQKSFSSYINELRINDIIGQLKTNKKLRNYTIKALAFQVGFNNAQSFSQAFLKQTGIYPSYFVKKLETIENE